MTVSENEQFQTNFPVSSEMSQENLINMQAAGEFQSASEYFIPSSQGYSQGAESEQISEHDLELELFLNEMRDNDFESIMHETLQELEGNFENYAHQQGMQGELEMFANHAQFENIVNGYFEASVAPMVPMIQQELDNFANFVQTNVPIGTDFEAFAQIAESYQPVHSEDFVKRWINKAKRAATSLVKRGLNVAKTVARTAGKFGKMIISGPIKAAFGRFVAWIRNSIRSVLRSLVRRAIAGLPAPARPIVTTALRRLGIGEYQTPMGEGESEALAAEMMGELESESMSEFEEMTTEALSPELEVESLNPEWELEEELEASHYGQNQVAELLSEFDTELFNYAEAEWSHVAQQEASQPYSPEASQPYSPEASQPYSPEASQPYSPEASQPYSPEASQPFSPESSQPYSPEASQPYSPEPSQPYSPEASQPYSPEASQPYSPEASQPYSPEASQPYSPEASQPYSPEASQPYSPEASQPFSPESSQPYSPEASQPYSPEASQPYSPEASQPYSPEMDSEMIAAYERFVNAVAANPSSFHQEYEQFAPVAIYKGIKIAFKVFPALRRKVVDLIANLLERLLGRWIPREIGSMVYRPLSSILLRLMGLEASVASPAMENRVFAEAIVNTAAEALLNAGNLPQSILEGDQQVLESELESIVQQAILNNIPARALGGRIAALQQRRGQIQFIPRRRYQILNRPVRVTLSAAQIASIRIKSPASLSDFLRRYFRWNGKSSLAIDFVVFRTMPGRRAISAMLRDYFGKGRQIRLTPYHYRQLHRMTRRIARMLKLSGIWSTTMPTYFIVSGISPRAGTAASGTPAIARSGNTLRPSSPSSVGRAPLGGNSIKAVIDSLGKYRVSIHLTDQTLQSIRAQTGGASSMKALRAALHRALSSGQIWLTNLLTRLRIPRSLAGAVSKLLARLVMRYLMKAGSKLMQRLNALINNRKGITISL